MYSEIYGDIQTQACGNVLPVYFVLYKLICAHECLNLSTVILLRCIITLS